jgi:toxin ParE1/3/4
MPEFEVVVAPKAEEDLAEIYRYIALFDGEGQAELIQEHLMADILSLAKLPKRGKCPLEMLKLGIDDYREIQCAPWRIFCYISGNSVGVIAVLDGRRDVDELLRYRLLQ